MTDHHLSFQAGGLLQRRRREPEPLGEEPQHGACHGGSVRVPARDVVEAGMRHPNRVAPVGPETDPDGVAPARGGGAVQVDVGVVFDPAAGRVAAVVRGALGCRELVEGAHRGDRPRGVVVRDGERLVVVDEVEEAPVSGGLGRGGGGDRGGKGEVNDWDGYTGRSERSGGVGIRVDEEFRDGGDTGLDEATHAGPGLVEGLHERGAVGRYWRSNLTACRMLFTKPVLKKLPKSQPRVRPFGQKAKFI
jgi:hypothetical protein